MKISRTYRSGRLKHIDGTSSVSRQDFAPGRLPLCAFRVHLIFYGWMDGWMDGLRYIWKQYFNLSENCTVF